jgi:hypothetical protein
MAITVKHNKVSTIPDDADTSLVRPSDWNADHTLVGLGTMAEQNATSVAITGGTINGTTIGATTPAAGTFTTITGQTEVLKGTGQNLLLQSQTFNTTWSTSSATVTANTTTAPDGTLTADTLTDTATTNFHILFQGYTATTIPLTYSVYAKANTLNYIYLNFQNASTNYATVVFDVLNGTVGQSAALGTGISITSSSITSVGSGWFRCSVSIVPNANISFAVIGLTNALTGNTLNTYGGVSYAGNGTNSVYLWGAQLEIGSTLNTYIPTTTTAVYGTPTLSFSGVSEIGLLSNGALYLQPAGTGALQAQATTSSTVGGNARGANAVDWQTSRVTDAARVASGQFSTVSGGSNNRSTSYSSTVGGGEGVGATGSYAVASGGSGNTASNSFTTVSGGRLNTSAGYFNFVGGGFTNSATSGSAVTTQSGTMNATTAVTLSGSNANIKVGQYITGTSIASDTYVAAISGTALTLSVAASGSSTSTLSFFTPHGVVVGGGNNQATGSYSFIGGGGDAGTAGQRNTSSGDWSAVVGGAKNISSGAGSFIGGGGLNSSGLPSWGNTASGLNSSSVGGQGSSATGNYSFVGGGFINAANSTYSAILGGTYGTTRSIIGNAVFPAHGNPIAESNGVSQSALLVLGVQTTDATATALRSNGSAASGTNQVILPNNSAYFFTGEVVSGVTGGGNTKGWTIEGVIKRGAGVGTTALVGTPTVVSTYADVGAATWAIAVTADTTNGGLRVTFTGQLATTIRTVCQIRTTEMTY